MINQVGTQATKGMNPFADFSQKQDGYFVSPKTAKDIYVSEKEKRRKVSLGVTIGLSALAVGFGILGIMKGLPKNTYKHLERLKEFLERKRTDGKGFNELYEYALRKINSYADKSKGINNIVTVKDVAFANVMEKWGWTRKIHKKLTRLFERFSRQTVVKSYKSTDKKFARLQRTLNKINERLIDDMSPCKREINGKIKTVAEWINDAEGSFNEIFTNYNINFGKKARNIRYKSIKNASKNLKADFVKATYGDKKNLSNKNIYQTFIAEEMLAGSKIDLSKNVSLIRSRITHDIMDNYKTTASILDNISSFINIKDQTAKKIIKAIKSDLTTYKKLSGVSEAKLRSELNTNIVKNLKKLSQHISNTKGEYVYDVKIASEVKSYVDEVQNIILYSKKGDLQELLTLYKGLLPDKEYRNLKSQVMSLIKSLDNSIDIETNRFFDKHRDLILGSAPTDVLSIAGSVGAIGWGLAKAKDKNERYSISLKYGIPAIGAIATSLYLTASLVSGGKAMFSGLISGALMNAIGTRVDDARKKYIENKTKEKLGVLNK